jgi:ABC-2 type transport system permease protein
VFLTGFIIGYRPPGGVPAMIASALFVMQIGWCISWLFSFVALKARSVSMATSLAMIIMFPMTFLSNAFVPTETMPGAVRFFAEHLNPLSRAITAIRGLLGGTGIGVDFWLALVGAAVILAVFVPLTTWSYTRRR